MGKYLDELLYSSKAHGRETNKPNKPKNDSSLGFLGASPDQFQKSASLEPNCLDKEKEAAIIGWLSTIEEVDPLVIKEVLVRCRGDPEAFRYFINRSNDPSF